MAEHPIIEIKKLSKRYKGSDEPALERYHAGYLSI